MSELARFHSSRRRLQSGRASTVLLVVLAMLVGTWIGARYQAPTRAALWGAGPAPVHEHAVTDGANGQQAKSAAQPTQLWTCGMHPQVVQDHPGECPICHMKLTPLKLGASEQTQGSATPAGGERKVKYWWDPMMSPPYISERPGKSPMGMDLVPVYEDELSGGAAVTIDPVVTQNMGLRTATVQEGPLRRELRVAGFVSEAQTGVHDVNLKISGWIQRLYADTEGMHVHAGDPLFDLYSPELQVAIEELIALHKRRPSAPAAVAPGTPTPPGALDALEAAATRKLELWGIARDEIQRLARLDRAPQTVTFRSPITGHVMDKPVVEGDSVEAGQRVLKIVDHTKLWIDARVFEQYLPYVSEGQTIVASVPGQGGKSYQGRVVLIHPHLDEMSRTAMVRMEVPNPDLTLRPGMYATVLLTAEVSDRATLVPREAVIDTGIQQIVFVVTKPGRFQPRKVVMGTPADEGKVQILQGLSAGDIVVVSGQFLLDTESRLQEALHKFLDERSGGAAATAPAATATPAAAKEAPAAPGHVH